MLFKLFYAHHLLWNVAQTTGITIALWRRGRVRLLAKATCDCRVSVEELALSKQIRDHRAKRWWTKIGCLVVVLVEFKLCLSVCLSVSQSVCLSVCLCLSLCLFLCLSFCLCLSACLSVCVSQPLSLSFRFCLSVGPPACLSVLPPFWPAVGYCGRRN